MSKPYKAVVRVNGEPLEMEIDTGAAVSLISKEMLDSLLPATKLSKPSLVLCTYTSEPIPVLGGVCKSSITGIRACISCWW